ncbi:unnamed protein product [Bursaphelenchus xylophilus]|uniref:(pine wood nematode) hypothetical protein n=1 Tax=Bursaphelenchus xylophilus TaxID=6326 RepID=A0A1I7SQK0_BURXY|nr:unnamed protein product [Bursaphelenchus xylophilus]CAG9110012.1 unnamed protein product [Bursaphelenchus xylophilus]
MGSKKNVICQDGNGQIVKCNGKQRISQVNYNSTAILLKLSNSNHFSIFPMPDRATYYYDNITSKFAFIEASDRSTIYLQKNKRTVIYGKRIFQQNIDGLTKLCLDRRCIEVNQTKDPITDHVHLQYLVDKDKALILVKKNVNETIINMIPRKNDTKTAPYYQRRGRFHCPSEVTCLLEIFYVIKLTDQILIQLIFTIFVLFYLMGNRKHLL